MNRTVFLLLDACKTSYVDERYMPFLSSLTKRKRHVSKIIPSPGYCERSEVFTGLKCYETGNFTAIGYDDKRSEYTEDMLIKMAELGSYIYKRGTKYILQKYRNKKGIKLQPYYIPPKSLMHFFLTEDGNDRLRPYKTLFDILEEDNRKYIMDGFTSLASNHTVITSEIDYIREAIRKEYDFIPVYFGITDIIGHKYGDEMDKICPYLIELDEKIEEIYSVCLCNNYNLCVLGDHGMVPVDKCVNIIRLLKKNGLDRSFDFEMFLDSAYARFWIKNKNKEEKLRYILNDNLKGDGVLIDNENYKTYQIPYNVKTIDGGHVYGDLIWCANPGVLIFPDYFNNPNPKLVDRGMHGYLKNVNDDSYGFYVSTLEGDSREYADLSDICYELACSLGCRQPNKG